MNQPIKRHEALQPWSREHHQGLLLSWKIKKGFALNLDPKRIKDYCDWFWKTHLIPHFETEEKYIFPILGEENHLIEQALDDHGQLKAMFEQTEADTDVLSQIESLLNLPGGVRRSDLRILHTQGEIFGWVYQKK